MGDAGGPRGAVLGDTKPIAPGPVLGFGWEATSTHRPALGRLEGRSRRTALGRHPSGGPERTRQLYVVSPEPYPALCRKGSAHGAQILELFAFDAVYEAFSAGGK